MDNSFTAYLQQHLSEESATSIYEISEAFEFVADAPFVRQGNVTDALYFIPDCVVRYYVDSASGETSNKHFTLAPCVVGSTTALIKKVPSRINIAAIASCSGYMIPWLAFRSLSQSNPEILMFYTTGLEGLFIQKEERETSLLTESARDRYAKFLNEFPGIEAILPQYHIASYLGITPVSLSRIRRELKQLA